MHILFTGFKGKHNPSFQLVSRLHGDVLYLTNSFCGVRRDIDLLRGHYDAVYMFGIDKKLTDAVRIEACAARNGMVKRTELDLSQLQWRLQANRIPCRISRTPTQSLCNEAYYHMLCRNPMTVFIHIPSLRSMTSGLMMQLIDTFHRIA